MEVYVFAVFFSFCVVVGLLVFSLLWLFFGLFLVSFLFFWFGLFLVFRFVRRGVDRG